MLTVQPGGLWKWTNSYSICEVGGSSDTPHLSALLSVKADLQRKMDAVDGAIAVLAAADTIRMRAGNLSTPLDPALSGDERDGVMEPTEASLRGGGGITLAAHPTPSAREPT